MESSPHLSSAPVVCARRPGSAPVLVVVVMVLLIGGTAAWIPARARTTPSEAAVAPEAPSPDKLTDEELRQKLLGTWRLNDYGTRVVTNRPDGTASMDVTISFPFSLAYGGALDLELTWTVEEGVLTHTITSGTPEKDVDRLIRDFGAGRSSRILSITSEVLDLEELTKSRDRYRWEAVRE